MNRNIAQEIEEARRNEDWDLHAKLWEERRVAEVEADEASLRRDPNLIADFPGYAIREPFTNAAGRAIYKDGDVIALPQQTKNHGTLWNFYTLGSVVGHAIQYGECPIKAIERATANGHRLWWANQNATVISSQRTAKPTRPGHTWGDEIQFHGRIFRLVKDRWSNNAHFELVGEAD